MINKIAYLSLVPPLLYALILTMSRSGLVAMLVIGLGIFIKSRHKIVLIIVAIIIAILAWSNMNEIQKERYISLTGNKSVQGASTYQGRIDGLKKELRVALNRPILGHGMGTSKEALYNVAGGTKLAHDLYTEIFIETGIIGLIIFLLFIYSIYDTLRQIPNNPSKPNKSNSKTINRRNNQNLTTSATKQQIYEKNLLMALTTCFWMYLIFSIAQYGLSEYHWYLLAGIATLLNKRPLK